MNKEDIKELYEDTENLYDLLSQHFAEHEVRDEKEASRFDIFKLDMEKTIEEIDQRLERAQKIKEDILSYTLQIVSIIVGLFALILSIIFLITNREELMGFQFWFLAIFVIFFSIIFVWWFTLWRRKYFRG